MDAEEQLGSFLDKFDPSVAADARQALAMLHARMPTATRMVYDNYNALAVGFGPSDKASHAILSIAVYPAYVTLFLLNGVTLLDPHHILEGGGSKVRHVKLRPISRLATLEVVEMIDAALDNAPVPLPTSGGGDLVIKSVSARQRPRRPT